MRVVQRNTDRNQLQRGRKCILKKELEGWSFIPTSQCCLLGKK